MYDSQSKVIVSLLQQKKTTTAVVKVHFGGSNCISNTNKRTQKMLTPPYTSRSDKRMVKEAKGTA
jgi:hypothetical protein